MPPMEPLSRRFGLQGVDLTLFLPNSVEFGRLPRRLALLEVELALFLPCLVELTLLPKMIGILVPM